VLRTYSIEVSASTPADLKEVSSAHGLFAPQLTFRTKSFSVCDGLEEPTTTDPSLINAPRTIGYQGESSAQGFSCRSHQRLVQSITMQSSCPNERVPLRPDPHRGLVSVGQTGINLDRVECTFAPSLIMPDDMIYAAFLPMIHYHTPFSRKCKTHSGPIHNAPYTGEGRSIRRGSSRYSLIRTGSQLLPR
jgi:hypothetical protein